MTIPPLPGFVAELLSIAREADMMDQMLWSHSDTEWRFYLQCSDTFAWGTADGEQVTAATMDALRAVVDELRAIEAVAEPVPREERDNDTDHIALCFTPELYAARLRGERPMRAYYVRILSAVPGEGTNRVSRLFDAAGPAHEPSVIRP